MHSYRLITTVWQRGGPQTLTDFTAQTDEEAVHRARRHAVGYIKNLGETSQGDHRSFSLLLEDGDRWREVTMWMPTPARHTPTPPAAPTDS